MQWHKHAATASKVQLVEWSPPSRVDASVSVSVSVNANDSASVVVVGRAHTKLVLDPD